MDYAYTLGATSAVLATTGRSGYMAIVSDLSQPAEKWRAGGVPFTAMLHVPHSAPGETFQPRPVIFPHRIDLEGAAFRSWLDQRTACAKGELYENPGPIQLSGPSADKKALTITCKFSYLHELEVLMANLAKLSSRCRPGCDPRTARVATTSLVTLNNILDELSVPPDAFETREK